MESFKLFLFYLIILLVQADGMEENLTFAVDDDSTTTTITSESPTADGATWTSISTSQLTSETTLSTTNSESITGTTTTTDAVPSTTETTISTTNSESITGTTTTTGAVTSPSTSETTISTTNSESITGTTATTGAVTSPSTSETTTSTTNSESITGTTTTTGAVTSPSTSETTISTTNSESITGPTTTTGAVTSPSTSETTISTTNSESITGTTTTTGAVTSPSTSETTKSIVSTSTMPDKSTTWALADTTTGLLIDNSTVVINFYEIYGTMQAEFVLVENSSEPEYWSDDLTDATTDRFRKTALEFQKELEIIYSGAAIIYSHISVESFVRGSPVTRRKRSIRSSDNEYGIIAIYVASVDESIPFDKVDDKVEASFKHLQAIGQWDCKFGKIVVTVSTEPPVFTEEHQSSDLDAGTLAAIIVSAVVAAALLLLIGMYFVWSWKSSHAIPATKLNSAAEPGSMELTTNVAPNTLPYTAQQIPLSTDNPATSDENINSTLWAYQLSLPPPEALPRIRISAYDLSPTVENQQVSFY